MAEIVFRIVDVCVRECMAYDKSNNSRPARGKKIDKGAKPELTLKAFAVKNQLLFRFSYYSDKSNRKLKCILKRELLPLAAAFHGDIQGEKGQEENGMHRQFVLRIQRG